MTAASWAEEERVGSVSIPNKPRTKYNKPQAEAEMWWRHKQAEDEDWGRAALKCRQKWIDKHPISPSEPRSRLPLPSLVLKMTFSSVLGK